MLLGVIDKISLIIFELFSEKINQYIRLKNQYEKLLINEKHEEAYVVLKEIEKEVCISIWSCWQTMKLTEKIKGLEEHKKIMSEYLKVTNKNILIDTLIEFNSAFLESNTSYFAYQTRVKEFLNSIKEQEAVYLYFDFKLNAEEHFEENVLPIAMQFESQFSIIDLYECYISCINLASVLEKPIKNEVPIELKIKDFRFNNHILLGNYDRLRTYVDENIDYYKMLDMYSKGEYDLFINNIKSYLLKFPQDFQAVLLFVKATINNKEKIDSQIKLHIDLYNIYSINDDVDVSKNNMFNYLKEYQGTCWESKLKGFISRKITLANRIEYNHLSGLHDFKISPNFVKNISDEIIKKAFLEVFENACPITAKLHSGRIFEVEEIIKDDIRKDIFISESHMENNEFANAVDLLYKLKNRLDAKDLYHLERINQKMIAAHIGNKDCLSLIALVVDSYLMNENLVRQIDLKNICKIAKGDSSTKKSIYFVILTYISDKNDHKMQRIAYSNFMNSNNLNSVSDFMKTNHDSKIMVFYLDKICSHHLLKRDYILNSGGGKADDIRIEILRNLIEIDVHKKKIYYDEIANIAKQKSIRDRIKQINQSRIFVDIENIRKENEQVLMENFNRYLSVKNFNEEIISIDITSKEYIMDLKKIVNEMNEKIKINPSFSQRMVILKGLLSQIIDEFLYNEKYGLNTFLSSRIRHGYCKNQLNSVFRECNLLSKKERDDSDEYKINEYWDMILPLNTVEGDKIKAALSLFTLNIENKIEEIRSKWLSIKYKEDNNDAYLDYSNCVNRALIIERDNIIDFEGFFNETIDYLWIYTEMLFNELRTRIKTELMEYFLLELSDLEQEISSIESCNFRNHVNQICANINLCKSQISGKVNEFSNVFYKRDVYYRDFTMNDLVDTCLEICGKLNGNFREVNFQRLIDDDNLYIGKVFPYFVDIINIMINNAMEHSGFDSFADLQIAFVIELEKDRNIIESVKSGLRQKGIISATNDFISITVKNNLYPYIDIMSIKAKLENIFTNMKCIESLKMYTQSEGGTGLYKLYKTLQYNIYAPYTIIYEVESQLFEIQLLIGIDDIVLKKEKINEDFVY